MASCLDAFHKTASNVLPTQAVAFAEVAETAVAVATVVAAEPVASAAATVAAVLEAAVTVVAVADWGCCDQDSGGLAVSR